ncbi:helix-turn-helix domain-containing protein [Desulfoscipio sp. XC116]|uniref:helix-turn-helix domain-containing protein n=1 Tax=Desulfoscipio sp. XC116 TaxID=3144975 RepID=UPI00325B01E9
MIQLGISSTALRETMGAGEAAALLGVSRWLIYEMVKRQQIPCVRAGKRVLFRRVALDAWMDAQERGSVDAEPEAPMERGVIRRLK